MHRSLQRQNTEILKQIFPEKEYRGVSPNFHIHASVSDLYIPTIGLPIPLEEICRPILGLYKSLTDTWMLKLGLRPRYSQKRNTLIGFSLQCLIMVYRGYSTHWILKNFGKPWLVYRMVGYGWLSVSFSSPIISLVIFEEAQHLFKPEWKYCKLFCFFHGLLLSDNFSSPLLSLCKIWSICCVFISKLRIELQNWNFSLNPLTGWTDYLIWYKRTYDMYG